MSPRVGRRRRRRRRFVGRRCCGGGIRATNTHPTGKCVRYQRAVLILPCRPSTDQRARTLSLHEPHFASTHTLPLRMPLLGENEVWRDSKDNRVPSDLLRFFFRSGLFSFLGSEVVHIISAVAIPPTHPSFILLLEATKPSRVTLTSRILQLSSELVYFPSFTYYNSCNHNIKLSTGRRNLATGPTLTLTAIGCTFFDHFLSC